MTDLETEAGITAATVAVRAHGVVDLTAPVAGPHRAGATVRPRVRLALNWFLAVSRLSVRWVAVPTDGRDAQLKAIRAAGPALPPRGPAPARIARSAG
jgi:hypothetical protein